MKLDEHLHGGICCSSFSTECFVMVKIPCRCMLQSSSTTRPKPRKRSSKFNADIAFQQRDMLHGIFRKWNCGHRCRLFVSLMVSVLDPIFFLFGSFEHALWYMLLVIED